MRLRSVQDLLLGHYLDTLSVPDGSWLNAHQVENSLVWFTPGFVPITRLNGLVRCGILVWVSGTGPYRVSTGTEAGVGRMCTVVLSPTGRTWRKSGSVWQA
jgi:hypothetical protein